MDTLLRYISDIISMNISFDLYSDPQFSIEIFMACFLCVLHILLIFEINALYKRTNSKAESKVKFWHQENRSISNGAVRRVSRRSNQRPRRTRISRTEQSYYLPIGNIEDPRLVNGSHTECIFRRDNSFMYNNPFVERVERLLNTSPSEYVRQDRARILRTAGVISSIQSLTNLLTVTNYSELESSSKEAIRRSVKAIRQSIESLNQDGIPYDYFAFDQTFDPCTNNDKTFNIRSDRIDFREYNEEDEILTNESVDTVGMPCVDENDLYDYGDFYVDKSYTVIHEEQRVHF